MREFDNNGMFYRGVVENNKHADKLNGQVQVRIQGIHTEKNENSGEFEQISTSDLPWAEVITGTSFGLISGIGLSSVLKKGTWVWLFLENNDVNKPVIIGVITGKSVTKKSYAEGEGFCDPDNKFPLDDRLNEYDINELARGVIKNTVIKKKNDTLDSSSVYTEKAQEPSEYPLNDVFETEAGHVFEMDNTLGRERVQIIDKHGNYFETDIDEYITKAINHKVNLIMGNLLEHIAGGVKQQIDLDHFKNISGFFKIQADGNLEIINDVKITGNLEVSEKITAGGDITSKSEVADTNGNLSSLRDAYDEHTHVGNLGVKTGLPLMTDPRSRTSDFTFTSAPKGFK